MELIELLNTRGIEYKKTNNPSEILGIETLKSTPIKQPTRIMGYIKMTKL